MHCIAHGIGCAAEIAGAITNAVSRIVHKMAVADQKSRTGGGRTAVNYLIGMLFNVGGTGALLGGPLVLVAVERQNQDDLYSMVIFP